MVADELHEGLEKLKISRQRSRWKGYRQAPKMVWNKDKIDAIAQRLSMFKEELQLQVLVSLRHV